MLNIAYFANQFADYQGHGMARYAHELYGALSTLDKVRLTPAAAWSALPLDRVKELQASTGLQLLKSGRRGTSYGWTFLGLPRIEWMVPGPVDVVHSVCMGYPTATAKPLVVTVHDLGPLTHPQFFSHNLPWVMKRALKQAVDNAAVIVAISQSTADEILSLYPQAGDRVQVVRSGVARRFFTPANIRALDGINLPEDVPLILTAGSLNPRKNVLGVLQALRRVLEEIPHHLVLAGGSGWDMDQVRHELGSDDLAARVHRLGYVSDEVLRALYHRADMYVHPSFYEGFGLTLLEAMASGIPVVTSNCSSLPEIAGEAAIKVNPADPDTIAEAMVHIATNPAFAEDLRARGYKRARQFSWDKTAYNMLRIYGEVT